jgi:hypothetical protein
MSNKAAGQKCSVLSSKICEKFILQKFLTQIIILHPADLINPNVFRAHIQNYLRSWKKNLQAHKNERKIAHHKEALLTQN